MIPQTEDSYLKPHLTPLNTKGEVNTNKNSKKAAIRMSAVNSR